MKIAFDAKRAFFNRRGLGNYSREILSSLKKYYPDNEYILFTPKVTDLMNSKDFKVITPYISILKGFWRSVLQCFSINKLMPDIYHGLSFEIPPGISKKVKKVVTIHDLIVIKFPQFFRFIDRTIYVKKIKHALNVADKIIAITHQTKHDIIHHFSVSPDRIDVVYQGVNPIFYNDYNSTHSYNLPSTYILYVGAIEPNKNLKNLILALSDINISLVIIGRHSSYQEKLKILSEKIKVNTVFLNDVKTTELPAIYKRANCFVLPSFYEGFGIPIVEALFSKIPVIASDIGALHESAGPDSIFFNPANVDELKYSIERVLDNEDLRNIMITKGFKHAQQFRVENVVNKLYEFYQNLIIP